MNNNNTIGGAGGILIGYGLSAVQTNMTTGLVLVVIGVVLVITVAVLQNIGLNVQSSNLG